MGVKSKLGLDRERLDAIVSALEACLGQLDEAGLAVPAIQVSDALETCRALLAELPPHAAPSSDEI